jgi:hypothetical protein
VSTRPGHAQYMRDWSAGRVANRKCVRCAYPIYSAVYCAFCQGEASKASNDLRSSRLSDGLCAICGDEPKRPTATSGEKCAKRQREWYQARRTA